MMGRHHQRHDVGQQKKLARKRAAQGLADRPSNPVAMANRLVADGVCTHAILGPDGSYTRAHHHGRTDHAIHEIDSGT